MDYKKLEIIGKQCQIFRLNIGARQTEVAEACGCHFSNVSQFERGKNNNAIILAWYLMQGLRLEGVEF